MGIEDMTERWESKPRPSFERKELTSPVIRLEQKYPAGCRRYTCSQAQHKNHTDAGK